MKFCEVQDIYLSDEIPVFSLENQNADALLEKHQTFNELLKKKYTISPEVYEIQNKVEESFAKNFKKRHITPPFYKLNIQNNSKQQSTNLSKSTQTMQINSKKQTNIKKTQLLMNMDPNLEKYKPFSVEKKSLSLKKELQKKQIFDDFENHINFELLQAKELIGKKKYKDAEEKLKKMMNKGVKHADLFYLLGETLRLQEKYIESENMLLKGAQFELHSPFCYYSLALIHLSNHNIGKAICFLEIFLKLQENHVLGHFHLAVCLFERKDFLISATKLTKVLTLNPFFAEAYLLRAAAFQMMGLEASQKKDLKKYKGLFGDQYENFVDNHFNILMDFGIELDKEFWLKQFENI